MMSKMIPCSYTPQMNMNMIHLKIDCELALI